MRKHTIASTALLGLIISLAVLFVANRKTQALQDPGPAVQALVLADLGDCADIVARMEAHGWEVSTATALEALRPGVLADYDVIWVQADANYRAIRLLAAKESSLDGFAQQGGIVVIWNLRPDSHWLDIAPGGTDAAPLPDGGAGPVTITTAGHPLITGFGTGGVALTEVDLDPLVTGGGGCVLNTPDGLGTVVIAENTVAPVFVKYAYGEGQVVIGALVDELDTCGDNVLHCIQSSAL